MNLKVIKSQKINKTTFTVFFSKPKDFLFYAGQYLDYELVDINDPLGNTRAFTISASPTEDYLRITTRIGKSVFKKNLIKMKIGDTISASHPAGTFTLDEKTPAVMIAGGIGITPFRSMIKYALDQKLKTPITLIYLNPDDEFVFKEDLDKYQPNLKNLTIHYMNTTKTGHLDEHKFLKIINHKSLFLNQIFYLAGPPKMVGSFEKMLLELEVAKDNIRYDHFDGY